MLPAVRPSLPSWCAPLTAAFEGSFFALCAVVAVSPASQVGLIDRAPVGEVGRQSSLATKAVVWLWMVAPSTFRSAASRERQERPVSALVNVVVLAATGFAPTLPRGLLELRWIVASYQWPHCCDLRLRPRRQPFRRGPRWYFRRPHPRSVCAVAPPVWLGSAAHRHRA